MAMKRILKTSVVLTVIACGVLYGQRAGVSSAPMAVAAASLSQLADPAKRSPDAPGTTFGGYRLEIGPIAGLTTAWHRSPDLSAIPLGSTVQFRVVLGRATAVTWSGATEEYRDENKSVASCEFSRSGKQAVRVEVVDPQDGPSVLESVFDVVQTGAAGVTITPPQLWVNPVVIDRTLPENELNEQTMSYFFGESIAALRDLGNGRYRISTSPVRHVYMSAQTNPPGFDPLIEWRLDGEARVLGGSHSEVFGGETQGFGGSDSGGFGSSATVHHISVGPTANPAEIEIETYGVVITSHVAGQDIIPEGVPVTFTAVTENSGRRSLF